MEVTKIEPGSKAHLTLLGVPMHWNFLTGQDYADMQAYGRAVWQASREHALTEAAALCVSSDGRDYGMTGRNCADQITKLRDEA